MINRRTFILGLLTLLGLILFPFHFIISKKKHIQVLKMPGKVQDMYIPPDWDYRKIIHESKLLDNGFKCGVIVIGNTWVFTTKKNNRLDKYNLSSYKHSWLDLKAEDGEIIILCSWIYAD